MNDRGHYGDRPDLPGSPSSRLVAWGLAIGLFTWAIVRRPISTSR
jgi:hypothetical protein